MRAASLSQLDSMLQQVVSAAERGDWDTVTSFAEPLETAVALLGTSQQRQVTSEALSATQALQKRALDLCAHRMECLRPLIQAFEASAPDKPPS